MPWLITYLKRIIRYFGAHLHWVSLQNKLFNRNMGVIHKVMKILIKRNLTKKPPQNFFTRTKKTCQNHNRNSKSCNSVSNRGNQHPQDSTFIPTITHNLLSSKQTAWIKSYDHFSSKLLFMQCKQKDKSWLKS